MVADTAIRGQRASSICIGVINMLPAHSRLAEIFQEHLKGTLSDDLGLELQHCLKVNADYCLQMNHLSNQLVQARTTKDVDWEADISAKMDWLRRTGRVVVG